MTIRLLDDTEKFLREKVEAGEFRDESEAVDHALRQMMARDEFTPQQKADIQRALAVALAEEEAGLGEPWDVEELLSTRRQHKGT